ncbi:MAG: replication initiator [Leucobacter sp.]
MYDQSSETAFPSVPVAGNATLGAELGSAGDRPEAACPEAAQPATGGREAAPLDPVKKSYAVDELIAAAGASLPCSQPITIVNEFDESMEVRCGTRRRSMCPSCAALYAGDAKKLLRSGAVEVEPGAVIVMLTLTAPSFGKIHRAANTAVSPRLASTAQEAWSVRAARSKCSCGSAHDATSVLVGTAVDPDSYGFAEQADWNASAGRLWNRTATKMGRAFELDGRLQYAGTAEMQKRGAVHFHLLLRLPLRSIGGLRLRRDSSGRIRAREVEKVARMSMTSVAGVERRWGQQIVAEMIAGPGIAGSRHARRTIGYLVKAVSYAAKDLGNDVGAESKHLRRAQSAALRMQCAACERVGRLFSRRCRSPRHRSFGYAGWPLRRSRGWSALTFSALRGARSRWREESDDHTAVRASGIRWRFVRQESNSILSCAVGEEEFELPRFD